MPLSDIPGIPQDADLPRTVDYLIMLRRKLNDFLNHLDTLNIDELDAGVVNTGILNAMLVVIKAVNSGIYFQIDQNGIVANNGTANTLQFDLATGLLTIVSALIQSSSAYPRVELNSSNKLLAAYQSATQFIQLLADSAGQVEIYFQNGSTVNGSIGPTPSALSISTTSLKGNISISSGQELDLAAQAAVNLAPTGNLQINGTNGYTGSVTVVTAVDFATSSVSTKTIQFQKGITTNVF